MKIDYRIGDMFKGNHMFYLHGCNLQGIMGAGVALQVKKKYFGAYRAYREAYLNNLIDLGDVVEYHDMNGVRIYNGITQIGYGTDRRYANYGAIQSVIKKVNTLVPNKGVKVAMPMIGCGLAGGDWNIVKDIIEQNATRFKPVVYDYTP